MAEIFPNSDSARLLSINYPFLHEEVYIIESNILDAIDQGKFEVTVSSSPMTTSIDYFRVFNGDVDDKVKDYEMNLVINYFVSKGYKITRITNNSTLNTFEWIVRW